MPIYNLLEYSNNYSVSLGNKNANKRINNNKTITRKSFQYNKKLIGTTPKDNNTLDAEVVFPLK